MWLVGWGSCLIVFVSETVGGGQVQVRREWEPEELIAAWTLLDGDWEVVANKTGATRLGFGLMLRRGRCGSRPRVRTGSCWS
jgi:hypothetical protein